MERRLKILKAVLLLRRFNRYNSKEKQIADAEKYYSDQQIDKWIEWLKNPQSNDETEKSEEFFDYDGCEEDSYMPSCTARDYSPSNPWDAPGMSIRDFI